MSMPNPARDPDGFFRGEEALRPEAVTVLARSMLGSGVLGSLLDRIDRLLEARESREDREPSIIAPGSVRNDRTQATKAPDILTPSTPKPAR